MNASEASGETYWLDDCRLMIETEYRRRTPGSAALFERARRSLPGGVSGNLRFFAPYPIYMRSGEGCRTTDVDGSVYIDCFSCNGPLLLGHRHPAVMAALQEVLSAGSLLINPEIMVRCAEALVRVIPGAERVRFLNSGTEAVMAAVRYARAYTRREKIVKFYGHYHGQDDQFLLGIAPSREIFGTGVPKAAIENTLTLPCNDIEAFQAMISSREDIAAVIIDPAMHAGGLWGVDHDFLQAVRAGTRANGIILVFDEVITGFRMGAGGAQASYGITPDLTTLAKALAAGEKLGAVVGSAEVMSVTDPLAPLSVPRAFQSGTGNDATMALAAAAAAIEEYERLERTGAYKVLRGQVERFEQQLHQIFADAGIGLHSNRLCSMMQLFLSREPASYERYASLRGELLDLFYLALITEGVILSLPTSNHIYFSFAHDDAAFESITRAVSTVFQKYPLGEAYRQLEGWRH